MRKTPMKGDPESKKKKCGASADEPDETMLKKKDQKELAL
jgi:hypothetical protein